MAEKMTEEEKAKAEQHQRNLDQMAEQAKTYQRLRRRDE